MDGPDGSVRFHKRLRFSSAPRNSSSQPTPSFIVHHLRYPEQPKRKMSRLFCNNINSGNAIINVSSSITVADDRSNILAWLSPPDPRLRHRDIQDSRVENVGEWLLETEEFRSWYAGSGGGESDNAVLFCYGDPGAGKTFIR